VIDALTMPHMAHGTAIVRDRLNVRTDPTTTAPVLGLLVPSEVVTVWAVMDGWAIVQNTRGLTGWASTQYLKLGDMVT
jgi:uncharacterized protein YraI